ncbi:MAG: hypothetical protein LUH11_00785 [Candidatus Gastranaerophilales bacterium]|nr:hypothetical protein [Candidatus Gastranaerophilales bacterium]
MNKNFRVITINGIRGVFTVIFVVLGLIAGFIISPGWVCMHIWNYIFKNSINVAQMNIYEGIILWAIIALSLYALNNKKSLIGFGSFRGLSPEQIHEIMSGSKFSESQIIKDMEMLNRELSNEIENKKKEETKSDENTNEINK